jgi:fatty-acyl-CoA synthase
MTSTASDHEAPAGAKPPVHGGCSDYVALHARLQPRTVAAVNLSSGQRWTYRALHLAIGQYAALLNSRGVIRGERIAALSRNRVELICLHLACARVGALYVPLNWRLSAAELKIIIDDAEPRFIVGDATLDQLGIEGNSLDEFARDAATLQPLPYEFPNPDAPSLILYTSGTSGRPKGVLLSENNIDRTAVNFSLMARITAESVVLCEAPMFHVIGLITNVRPILMRGGRFMVSDGFVPARTLSWLADAAMGVTHFFCVPQMAAALRTEQGFDPDRLRGLTAIFSGGAPHAAAAIRAWTRDGIPIADGFGMSEAGTISCMPLDIDLIDSHAGATGIVPPGIEVRILDGSGRECAPGDPGELWIKGVNVTRGYWRRPAETESALVNGWLATGDVARFDSDGYLWLVDRKKDMFISGGENVYPAEIEGLLAEHPDIAECAVVGIPDGRWGEVGHLAAVARPGARIDPDDVLVFLGSRLARYKIPKHISVVAELPRNGAGKLVKAELRQILLKPRVV